MKKNCFLAFIICIFISCSAHGIIQAQRIFDGPVINKDDIPGYGAIFNGDVFQGDDHLIGLFRMAREGYQKVPDNNERGYKLTDYYSDLGLFLSYDSGQTWEFSKIFAAASYRIDEQIERLQNHRGEVAEKVLKNLQKFTNEGWNFHILEDPRFIQVYDQTGTLRTFVFVTDVPPELLAGIETDLSYGMRALEVSITSGSDLHIVKHQKFGPPENKDNWVINIVPNTLQKAQMQHLKELGITISETPYPIALSTRINSKVQLIPFGCLEDVFQVTDQQWQQILNNKNCFTTILEPDGKQYRSLGNNDQPMPIRYDLLQELVAEHPEYADSDWKFWKWHFYHQTKNSNKLEYETWVEVIDSSGFPIFRLPYCLQKPEEDYEIVGDIGYVVFNAGNLRVGDFIYHFNGVADTAVAISKTKEEDLLRSIVMARCKI